MHTIDKEWRVKLPEGLLELSVGKNTQKVVLAQENEKVFQVIPFDTIPDDVKVITGSMNITKEGRIFIPSVLRKKFPDAKTVQIYVKAKKLYIEF